MQTYYARNTLLFTWQTSWGASSMDCLNVLKSPEAEALRILLQAWEDVDDSELRISCYILSLSIAKYVHHITLNPQNKCQLGNCEWHSPPHSHYPAMTEARSFSLRLYKTKRLILNVTSHHEAQIMFTVSNTTPLKVSYVHRIVETA